MSDRLRRTKIVTTLGPATDRDNNLEKIIAAGANVVRMNFSHGSPEDHIHKQYLNITTQYKDKVTSKTSLHAFFFL